MGDKVSEIMALLQQIVDMVDQGNHSLFNSKKVALDEEELVGILDQLRLAIPAEVERANKVLAERDTILSKAHMEAQNLVTEAKDQERKILEGAQAKEELMLRESEIVKQAESIARELRERSETMAAQIRQEADAYAVQTKAEADAYSAQTRKDVLGYSDSCLQYIAGKLKDMDNLVNSALSSVNDTRGNIGAEMAKQNAPAEEQQVQK